MCARSPHANRWSSYNRAVQLIVKSMNPKKKLPAPLGCKLNKRHFGTRTADQRSNCHRKRCAYPLWSLWHISFVQCINWNSIGLPLISLERWFIEEKKIHRSCARQDPPDQKPTSALESVYTNPIAYFAWLYLIWWRCDLERCFSIRPAAIIPWKSIYLRFFSFIFCAHLAYASEKTGSPQISCPFPITLNRRHFGRIKSARSSAPIASAFRFLRNARLLRTVFFCAFFYMCNKRDAEKWKRNVQRMDCCCYVSICTGSNVGAFLAVLLTMTWHLKSFNTRSWPRKIAIKWKENGRLSCALAPLALVPFVANFTAVICSGDLLVRCARLNKFISFIIWNVKSAENENASLPIYCAGTQLAILSNGAYKRKVRRNCKGNQMPNAKNILNGKCTQISHVWCEFIEHYKNTRENYHIVWLTRSV